MYSRTTILCAVLFLAPSSFAATVTCSASCIVGTDVVGVNGTGIDKQDAVIELHKKCDSAAEKSKATTHYLATSFNKPTANYTMLQTEFDVQKACL
jgi:hypothetical protein